MHALEREPQMIVSGPMLHSSEAQCRDDDWTGLRDRAERRRRQNRLNVRAYSMRCPNHLQAQYCRETMLTRLTGKRKALELHQNGQTEASTADISYGSSHKESRPNLSSGTSLEFIQWAPPGQPAAEARRCLKPRSERDESQTRLRVAAKGLVIFAHVQRPARNHNNGKSRLGKRVPPYLQNPTTWFPLYKDHLIPLVFYNVFRATITNIHILSLTSLLTSPCTPNLHTTPLFPTPCQVPETLMPTPTQSSTPHECWIDIFPSGGMRDNAIKFRDQYSQHDLCADLVGCQEGDARLNQPGIIAWSDPWHPDGWEVTERFVEKWSFLLKGCEDVMRATNKWRAMRDEEPLVWDLE